MVAVEVLVLFPYANERCSGAAHLVKVRGQALLKSMPRQGEELTFGPGMTVVVNRAIGRQHLGDLYLEVEVCAAQRCTKDEARAAADSFRERVHREPLRIEPTLAHGAFG